MSLSTYSKVVEDVYEESDVDEPLMMMSIECGVSLWLACWHITSMHLGRLIEHLTVCLNKTIECLTSKRTVARVGGAEEDESHH